MDPPLPPLPPINDNTVGSVNAAVESFDLDDSASAIAASVTDDFFRSAFSESGGSQDRFLGEGSSDDNGKITDESPTSTSAPYQVGVLLDEVAAENEVLASGVSFPTEQPFFENRYHNQKENQNEEGYDSEGNLPHFADVEEDDMEEYEEAPIIFPTAVSAPAPAAELLTVEALGGLGVKELKEELRKRGRAITGKKVDLVSRLKDAIASNVPVSSGYESTRHDSMNGLDMGATWVLLTQNAAPEPEPDNADLSLRPPTERDGGVIMPKFGFVETFDRMPFTGTTEKMRYAKPKWTSSSTRQKGDKGKRRKLSPVRQGRPSIGIEPRVLGGPNTDFLRRYGLDEASHPMDWFTAFIGTAS